MFSLTELPSNNEEVGQLIVKVQDELRHLREQIDNAVEGRTTEKFDLSDIQKAVEKTELGLKASAANYVQAINNQVLTLPSLEQCSAKKKLEKSTASPDEKPNARLRKSHGVRPKQSVTKGLLQPIVVAKNGGKPGPNVPSPGQQSKELRALQTLTKPQHPATRDILNEKYGVALPHIADKNDTQASAKQKPVVGSTVDQLTVLPQANRIDPAKTPPPVSENDASKGILSLLERGLVPPAAELSLEPSPVHHQQAMLHHPKEQFSKSKVEPRKEYCGVGGYNISAVKVDMSANAKETSLAERKKKASNIRGRDSNQGWTDNSVYRVPTQEINAIVPLPAPVPTPSSDIKSSHNFVIQNGRTRSTAQDFIDFKRHYCLSWGSILTLLLKLEEILRDYSVPLAIIDGDRLADLALVFELEEKPRLEHFLTCIVNGEDVEKTIRIPGRRYLGEDGEKMAAIKIQSCWRCFKEHRAYVTYRQKQAAAGVIAISWIMNCKLSMIRKQLKHLRQTQAEKFKLRARIFRARWSKMKESRRVIVHIPSLGYPQHIRDGLSDLTLLQNLQMARLCDLTDPKVEVIYVSPVELTDDVYQYYSKLLAMKAGAKDCDEAIENRYKIIVPDGVNHFPHHNLCLSSILKYSPKTVQRIKTLIKGKDAYIVPGVLHQDDLYLADLLDLPVLSPDPEVASLYSSKSGSKRIFLSAKVDLPPSEFDIFSLPQSKELRALQTLTKPQHPATRDILNEKYGVALPHIADKNDTQASAKQKPVVGSTVDQLTVLPQANRIDPAKTPPPVSENDASKGILSLLERGLVPPAAELSLEPSPVHHQQAMLHHPKEQFSKSKIEPRKEYCGVGGYNISAVKVDMSANAKETSLAERKKKASNIRGRDSNQGWTDNSVYRVPTQEINAIVPLPAPVPTPSSDIKSSHNFVIQNGRTRSTAQDFIDFKRHYCLSWGSILTLLLKLEEILRDYSVPLAIIDGDRLADLALVFELEEKPRLEHFLTCIVNGEDVEKTIRIPGRRYLGEDGEKMAAIKIQSCWRCFKEHRAYVTYRQKQAAAGVIAISWIMNCKLSMIRKQLKHLRQTQAEKFKLRARIFRARWSKMKESRRVIVHIPSLGYPQHIRDGLSDLTLLQNLQMARLCDLTDPKVEVIYVSPVELTDDVYQYYSKLLAMKAGAKDCDEAMENRYKIIVPDGVNHFPHHNLCLSSILKYSPKTVQRIKTLIKGKDAYIVPGVLHQDDLYLADLLDLPVLSPDPEVASLYSSKSGSKRIFLSAKVDLPPSEFDIFSLPQLHTSLAQLVTENLHVKRWLFKMDHEFDGRGTAYCDILPYLQCYDVAVKECQRYGDKWSKRWAHEPMLNKIAGEIPDILNQHATPVCQTEYNTWEKYLEVFLQRGGIIEACPPSDSVTAIIVDLLIEPDGNTSVLSTSDQIHATSLYQCWGSSVPQASVEPSLLAEKATAIAHACRLREIIGYISVDFVTFIDPLTMKQQVWAVDLKLTHSDSLAQMKLMKYVTNGSFDAERGTFEVPVYVKPAEPSKTTTSRRRRKTVQIEEAPPSPYRYAIFSSRLRHSNLNVIHYSVFFQMCRAHGIGFDMKEKAGTIFCLVDSSKREYLTMMVMSDDLRGSLSTFARNLSVVHQEISAPNMQGNSNFQAAIDDIDNILGMTEENLKQSTIQRTPQLQAPRPKELQKILQEHQENVRRHYVTRDMTSHDDVTGDVTSHGDITGEMTTCDDVTIETMTRADITKEMTIHDGVIAEITQHDNITGEMTTRNNVNENITQDPVDDEEKAGSTSHTTNPPPPPHTTSRPPSTPIRKLSTDDKPENK